MPIPEKHSFSVLSLHSPFTIFVEDRRRFGNIKICKNFVFSFAIALTFHYLCKNTTHCFICNMQQL